MMHLLLDREGSLWQPQMRMLLTCLKLTLPTMQSSFSTTRNSNRHIWPITASLVSRVHDKHRGAVGLAACHCAGLLSCPLLLRIRCAGLLHRNWHRRPRLLQGHAAVALFSCRSDKAAYTALDRLSAIGVSESDRTALAYNVPKLVRLCGIIQVAAHRTLHLTCTARVQQHHSALSIAAAQLCHGVGCCRRCHTSDCAATCASHVQCARRVQQHGAAARAHNLCGGGSWAHPSLFECLSAALAPFCDRFAPCNLK